MEEKKLTDEEIIYDLEVFSNLEIEEAKKQGAEKAVLLATLTLDFINRLQSENATLESELKKELDEHEEFTKKAKAEIERLKEKFSISHYKDSWKNKFFKAQEEVERLTEENEAYKEVKHIDIINELSKENAELQKQVDELTAFKNEAISTSLYGVGRKDGAEVAVKETAKEILDEVAYEYTEDMGYTDWLEDCYFGGAMERLCKKYGLKAIQTKKGVEVE